MNQGAIKALTDPCGRPRALFVDFFIANGASRGVLRQLVVAFWPALALALLVIGPVSKPRTGATDAASVSVNVNVGRAAAADHATSAASPKLMPPAAPSTPVTLDTPGSSTVTVAVGSTGNNVTSASSPASSAPASNLIGWEIGVLVAKAAFGASVLAVSVVFSAIASAVLASLSALWPAQPYFLALALAFVAAQLLRLVLWRIYLGRARAHPIPTVEGREEPTLLPSQEAFVSERVRQFGKVNLVGGGDLHAIEGRWGDGKSFLVEAIQRRLEADGKPVVYVHVWREQSEHNLHLAIVDAILSHPTVLKTAFEAYSMHLLARKVGDALSRCVPTGLKFGALDISATLSVHAALPLMAQRDLERVVAKCRQKGKGIVLILDEIDRATPEAAQAAMVLSKRAFNLPGISVVLPFVERQLRHKAFNPVFAYSMDLYHTFIANIQAKNRVQLMERVDSSPTSRKTGKPDEVTAEVPKKEKDSDATSADALRRLQFVKRQDDYEARLLRAFDGMSQDQQDLLYRQTESKYLATVHPVPRLEERDLAGIFKIGLISSNARVSALNETQMGIIGGHIWASHDKGPKSNLQTPTVRDYLGQLAKLLSLADQDRFFAGMPTETGLDDQQTQALLNQRRVAIVAILAWHSAKQLTWSNKYERP